MKYINAKNILPAALLNELQQYVQGTVIYVPENSVCRASWGQINGTREQYLIRNEEISQIYDEGVPVAEIALRFHLSEYSIKKIVSQCRKRSNSLELIPD